MVRFQFSNLHLFVSFRYEKKGESANSGLELVSLDVTIKNRENLQQFKVNDRRARVVLQAVLKDQFLGWLR